MIDSLYDNYKFWSENGSIYIIGDLHFDDKDCKLMHPNWPTPEEQIKIINSIVHKNDTLIILGDVYNEKYIELLNGYKVLFTGNHDKGYSNYKRVEKFIPYNGETIEELKEKYPTYRHIVDESSLPIKYIYCDNRLFDEVYTGPQFISAKILLSHEPVHLEFGLNIHGHSHGDKEYRENSLNVAADVINFTPINLGELIKRGRLANVKDIHETVIKRRNNDNRDKNNEHKSTTEINVDKNSSDIFIIPANKRIKEVKATPEHFEAIKKINEAKVEPEEGCVESYEFKR